jgi:predicted nucleic acid-binding protein
VKVVDASAVIDLLMRAPQASRLEEWLDDDVMAPELLVPEVYGALHRWVTRELLSELDATRALQVFDAMDIGYVATWPRANVMWGLRHRLSLYDACYVVVALELNAPLITTDQRLVSGARGLVTTLTP